MAERDVTIDILARDKTGPATNSAKRNLSGLDKSASKTVGKISKFFSDAAPEMTASVSKMMASIGTSGGAAAVAAIVAAIAVAAPMIGAALAAGILLGLGGGVLVAGIISAVKDPKVSSAFDGLKTRAEKAFKNFGTPFKEPLIRAAKTFGDTIDRLAPAFERMGRKVAPLIDKLAPALAEMAEKAMPGIERAVEAAVPLFEALADQLPAIGAAVGDFFDSIADSGPGAILIFKLLLDNTTNMIVGIGQAIEILSKTFHLMARAVLSATSTVLGAIVSVTGVAAKIPGPMQRAWQAANEGARNAKRSVDNMKASLNAVPSRKSVVVVAETGGAHSAIQKLQDSLNAIVNRQYTAVLSGRLDYFGAALADTANWHPAQFAASNFTNSGSRGSRTGGPVQVESKVQVNLDGAPFYAMTAEVVNASERRQDWRNRVGRR